MIQDSPDEAGPPAAVVFICKSACKTEIDVVLINVSAEIAVNDAVMVTEPKTDIHVVFRHNGVVSPGEFRRLHQGRKGAVKPGDYFSEPKGAGVTIPEVLEGEAAQECKERLRNDIIHPEAGTGLRRDSSTDVEHEKIDRAPISSLRTC